MAVAKGGKLSRKSPEHWDENRQFFDFCFALEWQSSLCLSRQALTLQNEFAHRQSFADNSPGACA